jgi:hypothetical protein
MMYRDRLFSIVALALGSATLAGIVHIDAYTQAARTEASAYAALSHQISHGDDAPLSIYHSFTTRALSAPSVALQQ